MDVQLVRTAGNFYLKISLCVCIFRGPSADHALLARRSAFRLMEDVSSDRQYCLKMRTNNTLQVILTSATSRTLLPQTPYKTLTLTRILT
jgi:hypothetical protein